MGKITFLHNGESVRDWEVIEQPEGYFYGPNGEFIDYEEDSEDVYVVENNAYRKLDITHSNFCDIAGVIHSEDPSCFEGAAAATQTTFNMVKLVKGDIPLLQQGEYARKLLWEGPYSSVSNKRTLSDNADSQEAKNCRKGLIHVLTGGMDFSSGAIFWDGSDFATKGSRHNKANIDGGIEIAQALWNQFLDVTFGGNESRKDNARKNIQFHKTEINKILKFEYDNANMYALPVEYYANGIALHGNSYFMIASGTSFWIKDGVYYRQTVTIIDPFISYGTGRNNMNRCLHKATIVQGKQIYWAPNINHPNNNGYRWELILGTNPF